MRLKLKNYLLIIVLISFFSCNTEEDDFVPEIEEPQIENQSGVVLTFDDDFVNEWYNANSILETYNWKATFFVTKFNQLSNDKIEKLKTLKSKGHEIAAHGSNHINAVNYIATNTLSSYLEVEITPMKNLMIENDLEPITFAYPYGARNTSLDQTLLNEFQIIRGTTYGQPDPAYHNCYYNNSQVVFGLGIDKSYSHYSLSYFISLLEYAKKNNRIVIFYSHKPVETSNADYETEYNTLIAICEYVKNNKMKFYKTSELYQLQNHFKQNKIAFNQHIQNDTIMKRKM